MRSMSSNSAVGFRRRVLKNAIDFVVTRVEQQGHGVVSYGATADRRRAPPAQSPESSDGAM